MKYDPIMKPIDLGDDFIVWKVLNSYLNMFTGIGHNDTIWINKTNRPNWHIILHTVNKEINTEYKQSATQATKLYLACTDTESFY